MSSLYWQLALCSAVLPAAFDYVNPGGPLSVVLGLSTRHKMPGWCIEKCVSSCLCCARRTMMSRFWDNATKLHNNNIAGVQVVDARLFLLREIGGLCQTSVGGAYK